METGIGGEMRVTDVEVEDGQCGKSGAMPWVAGTGEAEPLIPKRGVSLWGGGEVALRRREGYLEPELLSGALPSGKSCCRA